MQIFVILEQLKRQSPVLKMFKCMSYFQLPWILKTDCMSITSFESSASFISSIPIWMHFISCSYMIAIAGTFNIMLNRSSENGNQSLGWEDLLEKEMPTHFSILVWKIPWTEELGWLQSNGLQKSWTQIND